MISDSLPERLQGTDGIRGKVGLACDFPEIDPLSVWIQKKILIEEFFELYTFSFCQNLIDSGWAELGDSMIEDGTPEIPKVSSVMLRSGEYANPG